MTGSRFKRRIGSVLRITALIMAICVIFCACLPTGTSSVTSIPSGSSFAIHFIDVGQADAALIICDGQTMLIDGGNSADSNLMYAYLQKHNIKHLDYVVATHAHEDHVGGLSGALSFATVGTALSPVTEYNSKAFSNFVNKLKEQSKQITVPKPNDTFTIGSATVTVLGPVEETDETNDTSIVLRIVYGATSFLFVGDAEKAEEDSILDTNAELGSTVLKVGHHGSNSSTSYRFLREVMPEYAVISVGTDNDYGHPTETVLSRLRDADVKVYRTDMQGDIICTSDGKNVSFSVTRNADANTLGPAGSTSSGSSSSQPATSGGSAMDPVEMTYILNTNSKKFHLPTCKSAESISEQNKSTFIGTRSALISQGYSPCGSCNP